ncbi:MAG: MraY family glycosyltransferase [Candidatus Omnitrophota bacterium]
MNYLYIFILIFAISFVFTNLFKNLAKKSKLVTAQGMPFLGGLAILFSAVVGLCARPELFLDNAIFSILFGSFIIFILGLVDDLKDLSPWIKLFFQAIAGFYLISFGIRIRIVFLNDALNIALTLVWLLAITNAFNLLDVMDGLCGGLAVICSLTFFLLAHFLNNPQIAMMSLYITAASIGFLVFNLPPAKIYLGNSGSTFLGFFLASIAIAISYAPMERKMAIFTPVFVLGLVIYDLIFVMLMRISKRKSPIQKSKDHFALRLISLGFSKKKSLLIMYLLGLLFSLASLIIVRVSNISGFVIISVVTFICILSGIKISRVKVD